MDRQTVVTITFVIVIVVMVGEAIWRQRLYKKFEREFAEGLYDKLLDDINTRSARFLFQPFHRIFLRMNAHIAKGDVGQATIDIDQLLRMKLGKRQRQSVVLNAYQFYLQNDRFDDAKTMLDEIQKTFPSDVANDARVTYEVYAEDSTKYLDDMLAEYDGANRARQVQLSYLIALQYQNKGDDKNARKWQETATKLMTGEQD